MANTRVACLGASNFKKSLNMTQVHTALQPYKNLILNMAESGAALKAKTHPKSFFKQIELLKPFEGRTIYILFIGQNRQSNSRKFLTQYKAKILEMAQEVGYNNMTVLLALPRARENEIIAKQAREISKVGLEFEKRGIHTLNIFDMMPEELKRKETLYDARLDYTHYSKPVLLYVQQAVAKSIEKHLN